MRNHPVVVIALSGVILPARTILIGVGGNELGYPPGWALLVPILGGPALLVIALVLYQGRIRTPLDDRDGTPGRPIDE
jgi:hypothetical protein